ncbi:MAG: sigma-70 family RNA polymerase sigma factor [Candidatus Orphnella occulta]|nr:sigma-70 family RNA polymerase sigma factor [Candidatus Orphnella occulta]
MSDNCDQEFLRLCVIGDEEAWICLVKKFSGLVRRAIRYKIFKFFFNTNQGDIDEIFQQTFAHIWCNNVLSKITNPRSIPAYLTIVAQNVAADFVRNKKKHNRFRKNSVDHQNASISVDTSRAEIDNRQLNDAILELAKNFTLKEERIITLDLLYDMKHREIARIMDMPVNSVSTIIFRIKKTLKEKLKERGYSV